MFQGPRTFAASAGRGVLSRSRLVLTVVLAASLLSVGAAGSAAAHDNIPVEPGASGHCEDGESGGAFAVHGPGDHESDFVGPAEARSAASLAVYFAETQGECGSDDDRYLEAHVISAQTNAQYCYSEESDGDEGDEGHGDEATDPVTADAGAGEVTVNDGSRNWPPGHPDNGNDACDYDAHNSDESGNSEE